MYCVKTGESLPWVSSSRVNNSHQRQSSSKSISNEASAYKTLSCLLPVDCGSAAFCWVLEFMLSQVRSNSSSRALGRLSDCISNSMQCVCVCESKDGQDDGRNQSHIFHRYQSHMILHNWMSADGVCCSSLGFGERVMQNSSEKPSWPAFSSAFPRLYQKMDLLL